jgi:hypothetical protein
MKAKRWFTTAAERPIASGGEKMPHAVGAREMSAAVIGGALGFGLSVLGA